MSGPQCKHRASSRPWQQSQILCSPTRGHFHRGSSRAAPPNPTGIAHAKAACKCKCARPAQPRCAAGRRAGVKLGRARNVQCRASFPLPLPLDQPRPAVRSPHPGPPPPGAHLPSPAVRRQPEVAPASSGKRPVASCSHSLSYGSLQVGRHGEARSTVGGRARRRPQATDATDHIQRGGACKPPGPAACGGSLHDAPGGGPLLFRSGYRPCFLQLRARRRLFNTLASELTGKSS